MNPLSQFCHNPACSAHGQRGQGNIGIHSRKKRRYICHVCEKTFSATRDTALYRVRTPHETVTLVLALLAHGCPLQAIVAAFGFDERTVARWQRAAGEQCGRFHEHWTHEHPCDLQHVQADELWIKVVGKQLWLGMALAVPFRLWLGGVIGEERDRYFLRAVVRLIRTAARHLKFLLCVDGLAGYMTAAHFVFRRPVYTGDPGRPRLKPEKGWTLGQVIKQYAKRRVVGVTPRIAVGDATAVTTILEATQGGGVLNTAYIERLNATFRGALAGLVRRGRALARQEATLEAGMYLVGCVYNFCSYHASLRLPASAETDRKWMERTPAMAAGLAHRRWTVWELVSYPVPPVQQPARRRKTPRRRTSNQEKLPLAA